ncbi:transcriptional regulator [Salibacterium lacus]|uniref:Transcriptional regulator n=1 Tax=Salibacterium lacus TaxID=1898109 RepID=A0ABW5SXL6_9BACI
MVGEKMQKITMRHIESYVYALRDLDREISQLRDDIMAGESEEDENWGGGTNSVRSPSRPTEMTAVKLTTSKRLRNLKEIRHAISSAYQEMNADAQDVIHYRYWYNRRLDWNEVAWRTHLHEQTCYKYRREFVEKIADKIGWA